MKKSSSLVLAGLLLMGSGVAFSCTSQIIHAQNTSIPLIDRLNDLNLSSLTYEDKIYVYSLKAQYNNLSSEEKSKISEELLDKLTEAMELVDQQVKAKEFSDEIDDLLHHPTFAYQEKLRLLEQKYNDLSEDEKSYVTNYTEQNKRLIEEEGEKLKPNIYYDFRNPIVNGNHIVSQGSEQKNAILEGNSTVSNGYLSFGEKNKEEGSYLQLPSDLFHSNEDFTITIEYERTEEMTDTISLFAFGNDSYSDPSIQQTKYGMRTLFYADYDRGPHIKMATRNTQDDPGYTGIVYANGDWKNHILRTTIRYISDIDCIQTCTVDTTTSCYCYVNQGCSYPSHNEYTLVNETNFDLTKMNCNYLGAKDGYDAFGNYSFDGKIYSFAFYEGLYSEYQIYGTDIKDRNIGHYEIIDYVNHFDKVGSKFLDYYEEYGKMFEKLYKDVMSIPYDYRSFYDQEHLAYFLEAYQIYQEA